MGALHETGRDLALLEDATADADKALADLEALDDLDAAVGLWLRFVALAQDISRIRDAWANAIGEAMQERRYTAPGCTVERHKKTTRRNWQSDDLLRTVLDTRHVDPETGEAESQLDIIRAVYGLAGYQARLGALRERGLDPSDFCETEWLGWSLRPFKSGD